MSLKDFKMYNIGMKPEIDDIWIASKAIIRSSFTGKFYWLQFWMLN